MYELNKVNTYLKLSKFEADFPLIQSYRPHFYTLRERRLKTDEKEKIYTLVQLDTLITRAKKKDRLAQKELFVRYKNRFYTLCMRYMSQSDLAEDVMMQGFMQIFTKISSYTPKGSFEGWMHRIMVNQCLMEIRKKKSYLLTLDNIHDEQDNSIPSALEDLYEEELLSLIEKLPEGCRTIFNLYVIEGYKHKEIAKMLKCSSGTSKSQLALAKKKLREMIEFSDNTSKTVNHE